MREIALKLKGAEYFKHVCSGTSLLRKTLAGMAGVFDGGVTWLPDRVPLSALSLIEGGLGRTGYKDDLWGPFYDQVEAQMRTSACTLIISEARSAQYERLPRSKGLKRVSITRSDHEMTGEEYLFGEGLRERSEIEAFVDETFPFGQLFVLTFALGESGCFIAPTKFVSLIHRANMVVSEAFDGSGVVQWKRLP